MYVAQESGEPMVTDHTNDSTEPVPQLDNAQFSLTPEVASLLQNMAHQVNQSKPPSQDGYSASAPPQLPSAEDLANLPPHMKTVLQTFMVSKYVTGKKHMNCVQLDFMLSFR